MTIQSVVARGEPAISLDDLAEQRLWVAWREEDLEREVE